MALKREPEKHANHERWLVSYADFITLLFAVFVVLYAMGQSDKKKVQCLNSGDHGVIILKVIKVYIASIYIFRRKESFISSSLLLPNFMVIS